MLPQVHCQIALKAVGRALIYLSFIPPGYAVLSLMLSGMHSELQTAVLAAAYQR